MSFVGQKVECLNCKYRYNLDLSMFKRSCPKCGNSLYRTLKIGSVKLSYREIKFDK